MQKKQVEALCARAHALREDRRPRRAVGQLRARVLPDASTSSTCGELGDATDALIARLDESVARPEAQEVFTTTSAPRSTTSPSPRTRPSTCAQYFVANIQWSSGCPYRCEFCDIPELYGRNPRLKSPERIVAELDALVEAGAHGAIYFVDDNFIGNKKAAKELLPHLVEWQKRHNYPLRLSGECTLNVAQDKEVLGLMREAYFTDIFFGIESPDEETLDAIDKQQNLRMPILEAVQTINSYGIELHAGIILGPRQRHGRRDREDHRVHRPRADSAARRERALRAAPDAALGPARRRRASDPTAAASPTWCSGCPRRP